MDRDDALAESRWDDHARDVEHDRDEPEPWPKPTAAWPWKSEWLRDDDGAIIGVISTGYLTPEHILDRYGRVQDKTNGKDGA